MSTMLAPGRGKFVMKDGFAYTIGGAGLAVDVQAKHIPDASKLGFIAFHGASTTRPTVDLSPGQMTFDGTLGKPIWRNYANTAWVDATGAVV